MKNTDLLWYASYGSNINRDRFLCYIKGGRPEGSIRKNDGCRDNSNPSSEKNLLIPYELYFAGHSESWDGGGVAFIQPREDDAQLTYAHLYRITREQFIDIVMQENDLDVIPEIPFEILLHQGQYTFSGLKEYNYLISLGSIDGIPAFTFTHSQRFEDVVKPAKTYLRTIIRGLKEQFHLTNKVICNYLLNKEGITNNYSRDELEEMVELALT